MSRHGLVTVLAWTVMLGYCVAVWALLVFAVVGSVTR